MKIEFLDTTLRDGAQAEGISYSILDKQGILNALDELDIDLIEGGDPSSNPKDAEFFANTKNNKLVAFGSTHRRDTEVFNDKNIASLLDARTNTVCIFGKSSASQVRDVLNIDLDQNIELIGETIAYLKGTGKRVIFDAEHFFDGYKEDRMYAISTLSAASVAGADTIVLCDTNGGSTPEYIGEVTARIKDLFYGVKIGIHTHTGLQSIDNIQM
ncbi:MAG: citramalate synthase, partial [Clostridia bacterium]|nr:citramalate synthase [Clostridia bacterium]